MNTTLIKTGRGRSIVVQHDTTTPRPYSRINLVQGTRGCFTGYPDRIHIEGRTEGHGWEEIETYREEFEHPLWRKLEEQAAGAGHGGMDYLEDYRLIECLQKRPAHRHGCLRRGGGQLGGGALPEISVAGRGRPVDVPDFTRGGWKTNKPLEIVG